MNKIQVLWVLRDFSVREFCFNTISWLFLSYKTMNLGKFVSKQPITLLQLGEKISSYTYVLGL
jgi:hypothetical protein